MTTNIYPTHTCFDDALDYLVKPLKPELLLCHGIVRPNGYNAAHAWIYNPIEDRIYQWGFMEDGKRCRVSFKLIEYQQQLKVVIFTYYTWQQALHLNARYNHFGPWEQLYYEQTANYPGGRIRKVYECPSSIIAQIIHTDEKDLPNYGN